MELVIEGNAFITGELKKKILKGDRHFDFGDKLILPGGIDSHVHFRDPGFIYKEDFATGSTSAAYGGISCVLDMPNTSPPTVTSETLMEKAQIAGSKSYIDFGLLAGVSESENFEKLSEIVTAFKIYLASTTGDLKFDNYDHLKDIFEGIKSTGKTVCVHCEDERKLNKDTKPNSLKEHLNTRPNSAEASAIEIVADNFTNAKVHICHVSTKEGIKLLEKLPFTCEVTPHHLFLNSDSKIGARGKVNPPLREAADQDALWNALRNGTIDVIASDHSPHTIEEKEDIVSAPSGMPGTETLLPLMLNWVKQNKFELSRLVNAVCERPGEIFGLRKGKLAEGYDADIIMVDMRHSTEIHGEKLHSKCGWTAFEGFNAVFPKYTFVRGEVIIEDWELTGEIGSGKMVESLPQLS
jgi:dihydroorotase